MLTITEWAKLNQNPLTSGVVEIFARENPVLQHLPFINIAGNAYKYDREATLPGVAFRDYNTGYTESTGTVNPLTESLKILGGDADVDIAQIKQQTGENDLRAIQTSLKSKAISLSFYKTFFDGNTGSNPLEFDGLNVRLTGGQVISAGTNGAVLTLDMLDDLCDAISGTPSLLLMNKNCRRQITKLARNTANLSYSVDMFGNQIAHYAGVPIGTVEDDASGAAILDFDEAKGTSNVTSSIYAVRFGLDSFHGIQTEPVSVRDLGELPTPVVMRTRIEWYPGLVIKHGKAAARLQGVLAG